MKSYGFMGAGLARRNKTLTSEQEMNRATLQQEKVDEVLKKQDALRLNV